MFCSSSSQRRMGDRWGSPAYPPETDQSFGLVVCAAGGAYLWDRTGWEGKIAWGCRDISGDPIVVVLTEQVSAAHLAGLRQDGVSYIVAGSHKLDLGLALDILNRELGIKRLEV